MYFFYARIGLASTHVGVILAHAALGIPFVIITVTATLVGFDHSLTRAAASLGSSPTRTFFVVIVPLILPGVISGALLAFITSFDEVVVVLFVGSVEQRTIPWKMFSGIREEIRPTILAVADAPGGRVDHFVDDGGAPAAAERAAARHSLVTLHSGPPGNVLVMF